MGMEVEVMVDHEGHVFTVAIPSIIESPQVGDSVTCGVCKRKGSVITHVGVPHRTEREDVQHSDSQKSLLE